MDQKTKNQISYRNIDGIFVAGEEKTVNTKYCADIFNVLNEINQRQSDVSDIISILPELKGQNLLNKQVFITKTINDDSGLINNLDIIDVPNNMELQEMKIKTHALLIKNKKGFVNLLGDDILKEIDKHLTNIDDSIQKVSGDNFKNFNNEYKNSDDFKQQTIDKIDVLRPSIDNLHETDQIKNELIKKLDLMRNKAFDIYSLILDFENLRKKTGASSIDMDELKKVWGQAFPWTKNRV